MSKHQHKFPIANFQDTASSKLKGLTRENLLISLIHPEQQRTKNADTNLASDEASQNYIWAKSARSEVNKN